MKELPILGIQRKGEMVSLLLPKKAPDLGRSCNIFQSPRWDIRDLPDEYKGRIHCVRPANIGKSSSDFHPPPKLLWGRNSRVCLSGHYQIGRRQGVARGFYWLKIR